MCSYNGELIFTCIDDEGQLEVVDESTARTLHFGTRARQSTMFFRDRYELALNYTRCMMVSLVLLEDKPTSALMLGLGGGSLARFLAHHYPECHLDAVERRAAVIDLARRFFELPRTLQVWRMDAERFLKEEGKRSYDLVLVDLHTPYGMASANGSPGFVAACRRLLNPGGVLSVNLWSGTDDDMLQRVESQLTEAFDGRVLHLPVAGKRNFVALGLTSSADAQREAASRPRARELEAQLGIEFSTMLEELSPASER